MGAPLVGFLAEYCFHYNINQSPTSDMPSAIRENNMDALGKSLMVACAVPWSICLAVYSILHLTYAKDRDSVDKQTSKVDPERASLIVDREQTKNRLSTDSQGTRRSTDSRDSIDQI